MFQTWLSPIIFLFGLIVGSFLNCVIYRLETGKSFLRGRSFCPHCRRNLGFCDLVPVLSFLALKGKCRYCRGPISWQYPLVEISTAIIFFSIFNFQFSIFSQFSVFNFLSLFFWLFIACCLIVIFVIDLKHYIIPDKVIYPAVALSLLFRILNLEFVSNFEFRISDFQALINPLASAFLASSFFLAIVLVSRGHWMGVGDIKLAFLMGLILGWPNILVALFLAFFLGAVIGLGLIFSGKKTLKSEMPFGPFLAGATFLALFFGQSLIDCYLSLFW